MGLKNLHIKALWGSLVMVLLVVCFWSGGYAATPKATKQELKQVEQELGKTVSLKKQLTQEQQKIGKDLTNLQQNMVKTAEKIREQEAYLDELDIELAVLKNKERKLVRELGYGQRSMSHLILQLVGISKIPSDLLMVEPEKITEIKKSAITIKSVLPLLKEKNAQIGSNIAAFEQLKTEITASQNRLEKVNVKLREDRAYLAGLSVKKQQVYKNKSKMINDLTKKQEDLALKAKDLKDLITEITRLNTKKSVAPKQSASLRSVAKIKVILPVAGKIKIGYGGKNEVGVVSKGLVISARSGSQIVAPYAGKIVFAGKFGTYNNVLIIEHRNGYYSVVAGLGTVEVGVGNKVIKGEPVGLADSSGVRADVYFELRENNVPVNPGLG